MPARPVKLRLALTSLAATLAMAPALAKDALVEHGEYVARAAGCMSCHGEDLSGGYQVETPMGTIVASNISPSRDYGIGGYSRDDLAGVLRRGVSPDRRLYPAMPYASYRGISDGDIDALHAWLVAQDPVERAPAAQTDLPFPFNFRPGVIFWNALFLGDRDLPRPPSDDPQMQRGAYLVDHLGHCGECHTPRSDFFAMQDDRYLAGEVMDGWLAPNLTPDPLNGLGSWSQDDIVDYLRIGFGGDVVQAAGPMGEFVKHSTSHLTDEDLAAMAAYLKSLPPDPKGDQDIPAVPPVSERHSPQHSYDQIRQEMAAAKARADLTAAESLYLDHCAACHGVSGQGQPQAFYPPLVQNAALRRADSGNLLQVLAHGVPAGKLYRVPAMPGFAGELSHDQIATLANYTRVAFGGRPESNLTAEDVAQALDRDEPMPWPLRAVQVGAWAGVVAALALISWLIWRFAARRAGRRPA